MRMAVPKNVALGILMFLLWVAAAGAGNANGDGVSSAEQPLMPGTPSTVPAFPVQSERESCQLDLSAELFGGVKEACGGEALDRSRCCPVLAAWLYAAHARTALAAPSPVSFDLPVLPDDSQTCVNTLQSSLQSRGINIPRPNASCDPILCFCGIRLHQISSLNCPAAFNVSLHHSATPTSAVRGLEANCRNSSYAGCTKCLKALQKLKGKKMGSDRTSRMYSRDCELMGLTWLLAKNKTAYIPTVSAVLRAVMYSNHSPHQPRCSPDQENMPLAVDSVQLDQSGSHPLTNVPILLKPLYSLGVMLLLADMYWW